MSRCRQYRKVKKEKDGEQLTELEQLEQENTRLAKETLAEEGAEPNAGEQRG